MKIKIFSDIHLEFYVAHQYFDVGTGDVLILAGDIISARHLRTDGYLKRLYLKFFDTCSKNFKHIIYVLGNHCFYGYNIEGAKKVIKEVLPSNFYLLDDDTVKIGDWNFIGATFWTNFRNENPLEMMEVHRYMSDYHTIRIGSNFRKLNPDDTLGFHKKSIEYIENQLQTLKENVFVVTHHTPTFQAEDPRYKGECSGAFNSDYDDFILNHPQIKYWVFGHTHQNLDFNIGDCRMLCNAVGYKNELEPKILEIEV